MFVTRDGVRLFYQVTGSGSRDLFLLPQCQPVTYSRQWKNQVPYLSRYFRVATMDMRGNGRSDRPAAGYDLETRYQDWLAILDEVARPPFALVALSCAGMLALRYAVEHPDRLSHLDPAERPVCRVRAPALRREGRPGDPGRFRGLAAAAVHAVPARAPLAEGDRGLHRLDP